MDKKELFEAIKEFIEDGYIGVSINTHYGTGHLYITIEGNEFLSHEDEIDTKTFNVGDRVQCINSWCGYESAIGEEGTIVDVSEYDVIVYFDNDVGGWGQNYGGLHIEKGHGFFVNRIDLRKIK